MPLLMCPNCEKGMQEINRNDVQIDVCPSCRGVWLDRGELEKLLSAVKEVRRDYEAEAPAAAPRYDARPEKHYDDKHKYDDRHKYDERHGHYKKKKKKLDVLDIFDIF